MNRRSFFLRLAIAAGFSRVGFVATSTPVIGCIGPIGLPGPNGPCGGPMGAWGPLPATHAELLRQINLGIGRLQLDAGVFPHSAGEHTSS